MKLTPSQVKNYMKRGLRLIIDPDLEEEEKVRVRKFFNGKCAYCGIRLADNDGDMDHLVSGGTNALANRVLSCKKCNSAEKGGHDWVEFLKKKTKNSNLFLKRKSYIRKWIDLNGGIPILSSGLSKILQEESKRTTKEYDQACMRLREKIKGKKTLLRTRRSYVANLSR